MNFIPVISHAFAILLGWLVVAFATLPDPATAPNHRTGANDAPRSMRPGTRQPHSSPDALLAAQADMPMDPAKRTALKNRILAEWAGTDPDGLLRYLDQRPWLAGNKNAATEALATLARTSPVDLLDYAKREGCQLAIGILYRHGDPRLVLDLHRSLPPDYFSSDVLEGVLGELFARGCETDLGFHQRLDSIEDHSLRLAVFEDVAATLLASRRHMDLFTWLNKQKQPDSSEELLDILAFQIVAQRFDPASLHHLPDDHRDLTVGATLQALGTAQIAGDEHYQLACLTTFLENGWLTRHRESAATVIIEYYRGVPEGMGRDDAIAWKNWALGLPVDPEWNSLRRTAIRRWALEAPGQWRLIAELPNDDLRNAAYAAVAHSFDLRRDSEHISWMLQQITDPVLRNLATEVASERLASEGDPFAAIDIDPFRPLGTL